MNKKRRTQKERSESTKRKILSAATKLFAKRGFRDIALEDVVKRSGLTRGALYHHFGSKEQLFIGIVEEVERGLAHRILEAAKVESDPLDQLKAGLEAFLNACLDPAVQRILLLDAPTVLGVERWRSVDADYGLGLLRQALEGAMQAGLLKKQPVRPLSHLLLGALSEAGLFVAQSDKPDAARKEVATVLDTMLDGLRER